MTEQQPPTILQFPLRILMGKSYYKYKKVAEDMLFLNKAVRNMTKKELLAIVGYQYLLMGGDKKKKNA